MKEIQESNATTHSRGATMNFEKWKTETEERALGVYKDPAVCHALSERLANATERTLIWFEKWVTLTALLPSEEALENLNSRRDFILRNRGKRLLGRAQEDESTLKWMDITDQWSEFMLGLLDAAIERVNGREGEAPLLQLTPSTLGIQAECLDQWWREDPTLAGLRTTSELLGISRKKIVVAIRAYRAYRAEQQNEGNDNA